MRRILLVDSDHRIAGTVRRTLGSGYEVVSCPWCEAAQKYLSAGAEDCVVVLLALRFGPGRMSGEDCLPVLKRCWPHLEIVVLTAVAELSRATHCMRAGAFDYIEKIRMGETLSATVERAWRIAELRRQRLALEREAERLCEEEERLRKPSFTAHPFHEEPAALASTGDVPTPSRLEQMERGAVADALRLANGNIAQAARILGLTKVSCWRRVRKYRLESSMRRPR